MLPATGGKSKKTKTRAQQQADAIARAQAAADGMWTGAGTHSTKADPSQKTAKAVKPTGSKQSSNNKELAAAIKRAESAANGQWSGATTGGKAREAAISNISKDAVPKGYRDQVFPAASSKNVPTTLKSGLLPGQVGTPVPLMQNATNLTSAVVDPPIDPVQAALDAYKNYKGPKGGTFSGNLQDYIADALKQLPKVSYSALIKAAQKTAAAGDKDIAGVYSGLAAYTNANVKNIDKTTAKGAADLKSNGDAAAALLKDSSASGNASIDQALANAGISAGANAQSQTTADSAQNAASGKLASELQSSLNNNTSRGQSAQQWNSNLGTIGQQAGAESRASLQQLLASQVADYRTQSAQQNAANQLQAMQLGQTAFNGDRSYFQSQQQVNQAAADAELNRLLQMYQIQAGIAGDASSAEAASAAAQLAQQNKETDQGLKLSEQRTSFINTFFKKNGKMPTAQQIHDAGF